MIALALAIYFGIAGLIGLAALIAISTADGREQFAQGAERRAAQLRSMDRLTPYWIVRMVALAFGWPFIMVVSLFDEAGDA